METGTLIDINPTPPPPARTSNGGSQEVLSKAAEQMKQLSIGAEVHNTGIANNGPSGPAVKNTQPKPSPRGTTAPGSAKAPAAADKKPKTPSSAAPAQIKPKTSKQTNGDSPTKTTPNSAATRKAGSPATTPTTATARTRTAASPTTNPVALARAAASARKPSASSSSQNSPANAAVGAGGDTGEVKKLPMNKITVGTTPSPNIKEVKSKIGSLASATHRAGGGNVKISQTKLNWKAESKVGSLANVNYQPSGGNVKVETKKVELKGVGSKIGSLQNVKHKPGGGEKKIFDDKEYLKQVSPSSKTPSERGGNSIPHSPTPREDRTMSPRTSSSGGI